MSFDPSYYDESFEDFFPEWGEFSPEEYAARNWLRIGACSVVKGNQFKDPEMLKWAARYEEIFHNADLIQECRTNHLNDELRMQNKTTSRIDGNGF